MVALIIPMSSGIAIIVFMLGGVTKHGSIASEVRAWQSRVIIDNVKSNCYNSNTNIIACSNIVFPLDHCHLRHSEGETNV